MEVEVLGDEVLGHRGNREVELSEAVERSRRLEDNEEGVGFAPGRRSWSLDPAAWRQSRCVLSAH